MRRLNPVLIMWLQTWGTCQQRSIGLEYPSITAEARLLHSPGRSSRQHFDPHYEPDQIDLLVATAVRCMENREHALLLVYRYIEGKSDLRIMRDVGARTEAAARWQVEKAVREVASILEVPTYL